MTLPLVVEPSAVAAALEERPDAIRVVDLRPREAWAAAHVPSAVPLDAALLNRSAPPAGGLLPDAATVARILDDARIDETVHVVALDGGGATEAARLIWVLHAYGLHGCSWMNGGMRAWQAADLPLEREETSGTGAAAGAAAAGTAATGSPDSGVPERARRPAASGVNVVTADTLLGELDDPALAVLDVRGAAEYAGTDVRAAVGGHVPGAVHLEWTRLLDGEGRLLDDETLRERLSEVGIEPDRNVVVYCQTHQRSAVTYVALRHLGYESVRALDGAWSMWGNRPDLPKER